MFISHIEEVTRLGLYRILRSDIAFFKCDADFFYGNGDT